MSNDKNWSSQIRESKEAQAKRTAESLKNLDKVYEQELSLADLADMTIHKNSAVGKFNKRTQADRVDYVKDAKHKARLLRAAGLLTDCEECVIKYLLDSSIAQQTDTIRTSKQGIAKYIDFDRSSVSKALKSLAIKSICSLGDKLGRKYRPQEIKLNNLSFWFKKSR